MPSSSFSRQTEILSVGLRPVTKAYDFCWRVAGQSIHLAAALRSAADSMAEGKRLFGRYKGEVLTPPFPSEK